MLLPSPTDITIPVPNGGNLLIDMSQSTQLTGPYTVIELTVDGTEPSAVDRIEIDDSGTLYAIYENGGREKKFLIPLASVPSPDNLIPRAGNVFDLSADSASFSSGRPGPAASAASCPRRSRNRPSTSPPSSPP